MMQGSMKVRGFGEVSVGTKVEVWADGAPEGWGEVAALLPERQVAIRRFDEDETYACDVDDDLGEVFVVDWSQEVRALMQERQRRLWQPAEVDSFDLRGFGRVRVGTKLEIWDGTPDDEDRDWGEVTHLLAGERVAVHWYNGGETTIAGVDDCSDLLVDDWSPGVYDSLRKRAKDEGRGHGRV